MSYSQKKSSILWVVFNKIFESFWKKSSINSLNHQKMFLYFDWYLSENQFFESSFFQKGLILWDISKRKFKSSSHTEKKKVQFFASSWKNQSLILWVVFNKRFNSLNHTSKESSILWILRVSHISWEFHS